MLKKNPARSSNAAGFTLIELMVVVALLAAIAAIGTVAMRGPYRQALQEHEQVRLIHWLQLARNHARRSQSAGQIVLDLNKQVISLKSTDVRTQLSDFRLSRSLPLKEVLIPDSYQSNQDVRISMTPAGTTETFVMCFTLSATESKWILIAGGSGQAITTTKREEMEHAMQLLARSVFSR